MRQNFNQNQGQPQFNQNYNRNQESQQQQPRMQQGQQFQNNGNGQHQRDNISQGNEWDSFFQSSGVNNNGGNLRGNNQFNGGNQRDNMYDPVQNNSVVNDLAANQLLRGAFQQNNSSGIDQSMKQSLAKTMGLLGTPNLNSAVVQQRMALQNGGGGGGGGNLMQGRVNNPLNNMNNNIGGNSMNNNIGGNNGMIPGSYNARNAGGNQNNNNFGSNQGGRNMGGDGNNFNNAQQGRPQQNFNNNNNIGGYDDDNSYEPYPVNNNGGMRGSGSGGNYNSNGNVGNRVGGNLGGNNNFQQGGGNQRFNSMGGNNSGSYDEYEPSGQGQSSAPYNSNVPDPLSVLNKLNNIVAVTGGGLSAAQLQRAIQNPAGISHANPQQLLGITSGGPQRFPVSGGVPQRNLNAPMNNNLGGNPGLNRPVNNLGGNLNISANPIRNNAGVEVLPGDVRYRGNAPGGNPAGGNSSFGGSQGIRQVQLGGGGGQNNYQGNNISGSGGVRNLGGGGAGGGQWSSLGAAGVNNNNLNNVRDNFNSSNNNSFSQQRGNNQQSFDNNIGNVSGNNSIVSNNRSTSKWSAGSENPLDALFASGGSSNAGGAPRNLNTHNSAVPSAANGPIRKIAKGGFPGTSNYPTNPNVNVMLHSFSGNKRDRSNSSSRSRSPPARRDFRDDHHNNNSSNYNNSRDNEYNQGGRGSGGRGRGGGRGDLDSGRGRGFGGRNSTRSPPRGNARGPLNSSNNAGPLSPGPSSHSGGQGGRKEVDYVNLPPHALVEDFNIPAIPKNLHTITSVDLYTKFPNLYVPADFISVEVDWKSITASLYSDKICDITNSVPIVFENLPSALQPSAVTAGVSETPKYTYLGANTVNNTITNNYTHYSHNHIQTQRPVKFNAKVIISCGMANSGDRIDHLLPRKLRVLCGRRKGQVMLLGSSWCAELDGGNPLEDRSCLLNTARRAVYAQSLLDIYNPTPASTTVDEFGNTVQEQQEQCFDVTSNLTKLCEINYHRPKEEINNKLYPEQEEITAIYLYTIQPDSLPLGLQGLDSAWEIFSGRVKGENAGPLMNLNVDQFHEERLQTAQQTADDDQEATHQQASEESTQVAEAKEQQEIKSEETADTIPAFVGESTANPSKEGAMQVDASAASEATAESSMEIAIDRTGDAAASAAAAHSSALAAEVKEEVVPAVTATATTTVNTTTISAPATVVVPKAELIKPDAPTIFLCPAPLPKEIFDDNAKRQEAVALRMLPLSAILSYSPDDCSERIFEASIAGEFIRSIISVSNANIIVDFLIAENPVLSSLADIRVVQSVKRLREIVAASKAKLSAPAVAATGAPAVSAPSSESAAESAPVAMPTAAEAEEMDAASTAATAGSEVGAASEILTDSAVVSTEGTDSVQNDVTYESAMAVETSAAADETAVVGTESHSATEDAAAQAQQEESPLVLVSDEEARTWRRRFVAACRWFDADQERVLPRDLIQLIIHSSTRNMSRADVSAATDLVCRAGKISYETFV